jgi:DNA-binding GntR family transcriptional regulator
MAIANRQHVALVTPFHTTKAEAVAEWMRERIVRGEVTPGTSLQQEEIARTLDVSSTPVREAFLILEAEGYVERRPHRGVVVVDPPFDEIEEIREVRNAIERVAVNRICGSSDPAVLVPLQEAIEESRSAIATKDPVRWQRGIYHFHHALAMASRSKTISDVSAMLVARARRYLPTEPEIMTRSHEDHVEIARALEDRDAARALALLAQHETLFKHHVKWARAAQGAPREAAD